MAAREFDFLELSIDILKWDWDYRILGYSASEVTVE